ncbi:Hypothetical protein PENO1_011980 [Penicillium occitanis (nom. inval.)]|nr:Hypothetical protein PENO1_011980 [Penicillium occitanis (nom. inval.)]PCH09297.1 hypothetical protein PENOC_010810 [Penicillium occitanis (nom. inval.)]
MSDDEGEKFYFDYWGWDNPLLSSSSSSETEVVNTSITELVEPQPAILLHTSTDADLLLSADEQWDYARSARRALFMLLGRDFQCPTVDNFHFVFYRVYCTNGTNFGLNYFIFYSHDNKH